MGTVALGSGSDFRELLAALALYGIQQDRLDDLATSTAAAVTDSGTSLLTFLGTHLRQHLAAALARPETVDVPLLDELAAASDRVNAQIGAVPFVRLHLAQAGVVDVCRHLLAGEQSPPVRTRLRQIASSAYALAARLAFETRDDGAALALYNQAVSIADASAPSHRALIRTSQTMVVYYATGDIAKARRIADAAVKDARSGPSRLMRARAHALQAEMAARGAPAQHRHAQAALHLAWHDLDADTAGDPMSGVFSKGRLSGFEGICGIFLGDAERAEKQLTQSARTLTRSREAVQRAIVLTDRALATLRVGGPGAAEKAAEQLHECVDLTAATRGRVPAQRLRQVRRELRPWRSESFVADLDDHIHATLVGM
ncbi:MAG: hypothetical protein IRY90_00890 [Actinomadura rubrobrunea]|nr:hypothetical protein [Actinomadura rubrobrunea]